MKQYNIMTFGCQMNENDSEKIAGILEQMGYSHTDIPEEADVLVINTCSVRENADDRFFGNLGNFKAIKKLRPSMTIAVCGCMMQQEHIVKTIKAKYSFVDIIFGTHNINRFGELLNDHLKSDKQVVQILDKKTDLEDNLPVKRKFNHKAYVSITFGCDNFCTYCIVPYTRGREVSRKKEDIIAEITDLTKTGLKEVMLLGQNVNSYNKKNPGEPSFAELLRDVNNIKGLERIRFMTSHPKDFTDDIILAIKECDKVCPSVHLPLQSGSDKILKDMNRKYTREYYLSLVDKLRSAIPDVTISTDIIVGFPSETEEDFLYTLDTVKRSAFDSAFTFIYSPREGTKAAGMPFVSTEEQIKERFNRLLDLQHEIMEEKKNRYNKSYEEVIVDGNSKNNIEIMTGRTKDNHIVNFSGTCKVGDTVIVKITQINTFYLYGELAQIKN